MLSDLMFLCICVCVCVCRCRMYSFMGGGLFCAGVGNILLIVSTATDYWMQYRQSSNYMHQGLWRYCTPGKCFPHNISIGECRTADRRLRSARFNCSQSVMSSLGKLTSLLLLTGFHRNVWITPRTGVSFS